MSLFQGEGVWHKNGESIKQKAKNPHRHKQLYDDYQRKREVGRGGRGGRRITGDGSGQFWVVDTQYNIQMTCYRTAHWETI